MSLLSLVAAIYTLERGGRRKRNICVIQPVDTGTGGSVPPCSFSAGLIIGVKDLASDITSLFYYIKRGSKTKEKAKRSK